MNWLCFLAACFLLLVPFSVGFICPQKDGCHPYTDEEYSKQCPDGLHKCSNYEEVRAPQQSSGETRLSLLDTAYQTYSRDPCVPAAKYRDGHVDCPNGDDEVNDSNKCTKDEIICEMFTSDWWYGQKNKCFNKKLFCNTQTDASCKDRCQLKKEKLSTSTELKMNRVSCEFELEFDCGSFCIPKVWQHDLQVDCANKQDEAGAPESIFKCHVDEIKCPNEAKCIHQDHLCDGEVDCLGATDEFNCSRACPVSLHQCSNGQCIAQNLTCDGVHDCFDKSDEANCSSVKYRDDNLIICAPLDVHVSKDLVCDGNADCPNGFDESNCSISPICDNLHFECKTDHMCVPKEYMCDGFYDCHDGSDELECSGKTKICPSHLKLCQNKACQSHCKEDKCGLDQFLLPDGQCGSAFRWCPDYMQVSEWGCEDVQNITLYKCDPVDKNCVKNVISCCDSTISHYQCKSGTSNRFNRGCEYDNSILDTSYCSETNRYRSRLFCYSGFSKLMHGRLVIEEKYNAKLLMTSLNEVSTYDIMTGTVSSLMKEFGPISASAYWIKNQTFFWADPLMKQILSCSLPLDSVDPFNACDNSTVLHLSNVSTHSMAFDWAHRLLYFSDDDGFSINVLSMDSKLKKTLYRSSFQSFRSIQVDPALGKLYFVASGKVYETHFDPAAKDLKSGGTNVQFKQVETASKSITTMHIDYYAKTLYYSSPKFGKIFSTSLTENKRLYMSPENWNPVYSIVLFGERLYWTDKYGLHSVNGVNDMELQLSPGIGRPLHLQVIHKTAQPSFTDKCSDHVCDQLCFPIPFHQRHLSNVTYVCECGDGYTMVDKKCINDADVVATVRPTAAPAETTTAAAAVHHTKLSISNLAETHTTTVSTSTVTSTTASTTSTAAPTTTPSTTSVRPESASNQSYIEHVKIEHSSGHHILLTVFLSVVVSVSIIGSALFLIKKYRRKTIPCDEVVSFATLRANDETSFNSGIVPSAAINFSNPSFET